jgi:cell wall-associated NlpC family hydrolase
MAVAGTAALTSGLVIPSSASADQISTLQAQASAIAARITTLGNQEEALAEKYDAAQGQVQALQDQVATAHAQLAAAQATMARAREALKADAVQAYVTGGNESYGSGDAIQNATSSLLRAEYINTLATNQSDDIDQYRLATLQEQAASTQLNQQEKAAQAEVDSLDNDRSAVEAADTQLTSQQSQVAAEIVQLKAEQAAAERAAAAAAAARRAAAERAAEEQAAALAAEAAQLQAAAPAPALAPAAAGAGAAGAGAGATTTPAVAVNYTAPPAGSGASGAVAAAESRLGDWYQWGATGPTTFDCSGLVMWAYAQVGISLPHYSGSQYDDTTHIPMSDLQPGDLVFFSDPGEHVAMYVGGGDIIEAPHTGAQVHIVPMYSEFTLAGRVS